MQPILDVQNISISFDTHAGEVKAVDGVSFQVYPGEAIGLVGESGCGKSVTAQSIMRLISTPPGRYVNGKILFEDRDLLTLPEQAMRQIRGNDISMIFQDPMTSLNPVLTTGTQIAETIMCHRRLSKQDAFGRAAELMRLVGIPMPEERLGSYPHQLSGGMRQRAMIAMSLACNPKLLIADEPTTALDVTIQAQILDLLKSLREQLQMAIVLISHDLGAVAGLCSRVIVMYAGKVAEAGTVRDIFHRPQHPYTRSLLQSVPRLDMLHKQKLAVIEGQPPNLLCPPSGCPFHPRCAFAMRICAEQYPISVQMSSDHSVNCWLQHPAASKTAREVLG